MLSVFNIVATAGVVSLVLTASSDGLRASRSRKSSLQEPKKGLISTTIFTNFCIQLCNFCIQGYELTYSGFNRTFAKLGFQEQ